ncbi:MAG TPA: hypothetical protein VFO66_05805 [Gemmatimonadaceae bacterium]|nr:hypothetical protein [Gemmatimonadaceae bacterium]
MAASISVVACNDSLDVQNVTSPDITRALSTPAGIEQLVSTGFQQAHLATVANNMTPQLNVFGLESYGSVANFGMNTRGGIPRIQVQNERGNATAGENYADYRTLSKVARSMANGIQAIDAMVTAGGTMGSVGRNMRARAFAFFVMGVAHGNLALMYDSVAVLEATTAADVNPPLSGYAAAMARAIENLDSAVAIAGGIATAEVGNFSLPAGWINGNAMTRDQFVQMVRSFRARYRAGVARTPAERAAVNWASVISDATNGLTTDLNITLTNSGGWSHGYIAQMYTYSGWHMMPANIIGFADSVGGEYDTWVNTPALTARNSAGTTFLFIRTADRRFPAGDTRAAQTAASGCTASNTNANCKPGLAGGLTGQTNNLPYFRNRLGGGDDTKGEAWAQTQYDHYRFRYLTLGNANRDGLWPTMTKAEVDLLAAEGYIRTGNYAAAATLIDRTRTAQGGLPSVVGMTMTAAGLTDPWSGSDVPGGNACVPRVPKTSAAGRECGNLFEALKWEKRLETAFTGYGQWYVDSRGWGDLPEGTALSWPVPYQELDARYPGNTNFYYLGGSTANQGAPKGTYGW